MVDNSHSVSVTDVIGLPATATIAHSPNGNICGLRLPDGRLVRPWITWEIEDAGENHRELDHDDMLALGFQPTLETAIAIDPA